MEEIIKLKRSSCKDCSNFYLLLMKNEKGRAIWIFWFLSSFRKKHCLSKKEKSKIRIQFFNYLHDFDKNGILVDNMLNILQYTKTDDVSTKDQILERQSNSNVIYVMLAPTPTIVLIFVLHWRIQIHYKQLLVSLGWSCKIELM